MSTVGISSARKDNVIKSYWLKFIVCFWKKKIIWSDMFFAKFYNIFRNLSKGFFDLRSVHSILASAYNFLICEKGIHLFWRFRLVPLFYIVRLARLLATSIDSFTRWWKPKCGAYNGLGLSRTAIYVWLQNQSSKNLRTSKIFKFLKISLINFINSNFWYSSFFITFDY